MPCRAFHLLASMLLVTCIALPGCRSLSGGSTVTPASVYPERISIVHGRRLVLPLEGELAEVPRPIRVRLDDSRPLSARLCVISARAVSPAPGWLGHDMEYEASYPTDPEAEATHLVIDLPIDAVGQSIWVGPVHVLLDWLPDPYLVTTHEPAWESPLSPDERGDERLSSLLRPLLDDPYARWRARLLLEGLTPRRLLEEPEGSHAHAFADPALEAIAEARESQWQVALARVWMIDPVLAAELRDGLVRTVHFGDDLVPMWPSDTADLDALLDDLLLEGLSDARRTSRVRAWLTMQAEALAWVIDDAGAIDPQTGMRAARIGTVNLGNEPTLAWLRAIDSRVSPEPLPSPALAAVDLLVPLSPPLPAQLPLEVRVGQWRGECRVAAGAAPARPPGVALVPFHADLTLRDLSNGTSRTLTSDAPHRIAALLRRSSVEDESWSLFVECVGVPDAIVRVYLGPSGSPHAVYRVTRSGEMQDELDRGSAPVTIPSVASEARWSCQIPIADGSIEPDGVLLIAVTLESSRLGRVTFPRPMLPWQEAPGRIAIDTTTWDDLHAAGR
jgi:hypothetical protein